MTTRPILPKATAVWLVDNTSLTFEQIAEFCGLHTLEVHSMADGEVAQSIKGLDPINTGQLSREELERCQAEPTARLQLMESRHDLPVKPRRQGARYTPLSHRQDRPNAISWLVRNHPEISDAQIGKLVGTTKPTIQKVRDRSHWNAANIKPSDPVTLGLCSQTDLDRAVTLAANRAQKAAEKTAKEDAAARAASGEAPESPAPPAEPETPKTAELKQLSRKQPSQKQLSQKQLRKCFPLPPRSQSQNQSRTTIPTPFSPASAP